MSFSFEVFERVEESKSGYEHIHSNHFIRSLVTSSSLHVVNEVWNIKSHLWSGCWSSVIIFNKTIMELSGHTDNHVVIIRVEWFSLRNIHAEGWLEEVTSWNIINVSKASRSKSNFGEISGPNSLICVFSLILWVVRRINSVVNNSVSFIPFLVVVLFKVVVSRVNSEILAHNGS